MESWSLIFEAIKRKPWVSQVAMIPMGKNLQKQEGSRQSDIVGPRMNYITVPRVDCLTLL